MALSRMTLLPILLAAPAIAMAADGAGITAAQAGDPESHYRTVFPTIAELDCPTRTGDDIVVCARRDERTSPRLPLAVEPVEGARVSGMGTTSAAMGAVDHHRCSPVGPHSQCSGGLPIPQAIMLMVEAAKKIADPDR